MKFNALLAGVLLAIIAGTIKAEDFAASKFTLASGEKKSFHVTTDNVVKVSYTTGLSMDQMKSCKNMGIRIHVVDDQFLDASSPVGTGFTLKPVDGKVSVDVEFENLESFPIPVELSRE
ncbi:MAG: hypothetical protein U1F34_09420 [Gammaproteobacteria bacterium]